MKFEKAHPDVFNILLQVLDDGHLTDSKGRKVDFRNTVIIMTSNLGAVALREEKSVGFGAKTVQQNHDAMEKRIREELKNSFRPELLNRIDETIVFHKLQKEELRQICWHYGKRNYFKTTRVEYYSENYFCSIRCLSRRRI